MKKVVVGILAVIGGLAILATVAFAGLTLISVMAKPGVPSSVILEIDFEQPIIEAVPEDPIAQLMLDETLEVRDIVDALDRAAGDRRVKAVVARIGGRGIGLAHIQEFRDAVTRFRDSGKPAIAFAEAFGEFGPGNGGYLLATAFDEIYVHPTGDVGLTGLMYESMFMAGTLEKLDVVPRVGQRHEYKNAANTYTETEYTDAHREAMEKVLGSQFAQLVAGITDRRELEADRVRQLIDGGPYSGEEALEAGLIDGLAYRDEVYDDVRERAGGRAKLLYLSHYLTRAGRPNSRGRTVALIEAHGTIVRGNSAYSVLDGTILAGSESISRAFRAAIDDRRVEAILFRVDSPGGSPLASDAIWRQTIRAREAGKPVIVSMGNLAGSGGYYVAMSADKIVAQPGTITASIGVLGGKLVTRGLWNKLGITFDEVHAGENAPIWSSIQDYDVAENARIQAVLDRTYEEFTRKVAEGRDLPLDEVLDLARGRIWTGEDAKELGLVDELGGMEVALDLARAAIGVEEDEPIRIRRFPREKSAFEAFFGAKAENSERATIATLVKSLDSVQPQIRALKKLGLVGERYGLMMPQTPEFN